MKMKSDIEMDSNILLSWEYGLDIIIFLIDKFSISIIPSLIIVDKGGTHRKTMTGVTHASDIIQTINSSILIDSAGEHENTLLINSLLKDIFFQSFTSLSIIVIIYLKLVSKLKTVN